MNFKRDWLEEDTPHSKAILQELRRWVLRRWYRVLIGTKVISDWLDDPPDRSPRTNGEMMLAWTWRSSTRPIIWMTSLIIAGLIGYDLSSSSTSEAIIVDYSRLVNAAVFIALLFLALQLLKILFTFSRVIRRWALTDLSESESLRRDRETNKFGYSMSREYRSTFGSNGLGWVLCLLLVASCLAFRRSLRWGSQTQLDTPESSLW